MSDDSYGRSCIIVCNKQNRKWYNRRYDSSFFDDIVTISIKSF